MLPTLSTVSGALALLLSAATVSADTARGLAWATNNNFAPTIGSKPRVTWYHHWQDGPVSQMPKKNEYVPMFWGAKKWDKWNKRKAEMKKNKPKHLLGFNEPDISSQGNMSPEYAAQVWMQEINPWGKKGVKLGSPAIAWDLNWMGKFLSALKKKGGYVDFICIHWYGSHKDLAKFKKFVEATHKRFGRDIWITELGITSASHPSKQQTKNFMMQAYSWMDKTGYVKRASWFGCFQENQPPDSYATGKNALFKNGNRLSDMGYWYGYTSKPNRRSLQSRHARLAIAAREAEEATDDADDEVYEGEAEDCDEICKLRTEAVDAWFASAPETEEREVEERQIKVAEIVRA